jgi:hypothetical protein
MESIPPLSFYTVTIVDVTDRSNPQQLSRTAYDINPFTHQGLLSTDQSHIVFSDEGDEMS